MQKSLLSSDVLGEEHFTSALDRRDFEYLFDLPTSMTTSASSEQ
jgi:hypothetical protein